MERSLPSSPANEQEKRHAAMALPMQETCLKLPKQILTVTATTGIMIRSINKIRGNLHELETKPVRGFCLRIDAAWRRIAGEWRSAASYSVARHSCGCGAGHSGRSCRGQFADSGGRRSTCIHADTERLDDGGQSRAGHHQWRRLRRSAAGRGRKRGRRGQYCQCISLRRHPSLRRWHGAR